MKRSTAPDHQPSKKLARKEASPSSPAATPTATAASSTTSWTSLNLKPNLLKGILAFGFASPSQVQQLAITPIIRGRDTIVQSQSGTGKTAVFCIAVLQVLKEKERHTQAVLLAPTRELAEQTSIVVRNLGDYLGASVQTLVGGKLLKEDMRALAAGPHIVSGTPGRVYDVIKRGLLDVRRCAVLVVDEADEMMGANKRVVDDIFRELPASVQVVLVSATVTPAVLEMARDYMNEPHKVLVKRQDVSLEGIAQYHVVLEPERKFDALCDLVNALLLQQAVIFCNTRRRVDWLANKLKGAGFGCISMHGDMDQKERDKAMQQFRMGACRVLCTTDVWGRGLDVQQISLVVNFDLPPSKELYIHRIGRSGRWGRKGLAVSFCEPDELAMLRGVEKHFKIRVPVLPRNVKDL